MLDGRWSPAVVMGIAQAEGISAQTYLIQFEAAGSELKKGWNAMSGETRQGVRHHELRPSSEFPGPISDQLPHSEADLSEAMGAVLAKHAVSELQRSSPVVESPGKRFGVCVVGQLSRLELETKIAKLLKPSLSRWEGRVDVVIVLDPVSFSNVLGLCHVCAKKQPLYADPIVVTWSHPAAHPFICPSSTLHNIWPSSSCLKRKGKPLP
jgi:hypothetical protein